MERVNRPIHERKAKTFKDKGELDFFVRGLPQPKEEGFNDLHSTNYVDVMHPKGLFKCG